MYDLKALRENLDHIRETLGRRGNDVPWDDLRKLSDERRTHTMQVEQLRQDLNKGSEEVARLRRAKEPAETAMAAMKQLGDRIKDAEGDLRKVEDALTDVALRIPNLPHASVPVGADASKNVEVRRWGAVPSFSSPPKPHWEVGEHLGILDFDRAAKIAGARFSVMTGAGARLERALINYMLDLHTTQHGYREVLPPLMANRASMTGTGQLPKFEEDLFRMKDEDYFLIPTAEVPVTNLHREEILGGDRLPLRYTSYTPCFRREAGSYGKDTRGLIRLHQFNKVELVAFTTPDRSYEELERLTSHAESILQGLRLPYRVIALCTGDMGFSAAKTYDLEVWLPSQQQYREISSCSNFESFQARRASIKYRLTGGKKEAKADFVHTLNGSGLAVGRTVVAILENFQQPDGSVEIPPVLRPYMGGIERITRQ
ncbi:serine--tRNA ligase [Candidatus Nitrospira nitrificans]|uniref:Serine--tRNA ligase n=1 Tax=Candidatus Nitrospira nitrificans TaxID=1742973 RepID=A0A0S4LMH9_9BACT|nr:serine--tRNA ligase [Candidatus Nitrospira nitrificans]CUS37946.1 seryl-tRNA synthetase, also charges selenocysteinyl-tRNA with serine [Candidatus Nitrospira nitrificans]